MRPTKLPEEVADRIWNVLVEECGASPDLVDGGMFRVRASTEGITEYRFCGSLGFGGKVWVSGSNCYVTCYPEDRNPERDAAIDRANRRLAVLMESVSARS